MITGQQAYADFYFPEITSVPITGSAMNITISNSTTINAPTLYYKPLFDIKWKNVAALSTGADKLNFTIPKEDLGGQEVYEYFFVSSGNERYPLGDATIKIALSKRVLKYRLLAENITRTDSGSLCNPWTNPPPWSGTQTCASEDNHAWMMIGFKTADTATQNNTYAQKLLDVSIENITHTTRPSISTCDHTKGDYNCESTNQTGWSITGSDPIIDGSERQALMIYSMWQNYRNTKNTAIKQIAKSYTLGSADDCDAWADNYSCRTPDDVGLMILAYLEAWELTGNSTYLSKALSFSDEGSTRSLQDNTSMFLAMGLLKAYELTGNYTQQAIEQTNELYEYCISDVCDSNKQNTNLLLSKEVYRLTGEYKYLRATIALANKNNSIDCNPNTGDYSCTSPEEQGLVAAAFWGAYETIPDRGGFYMPEVNSIPNLNNDLNMTIYLRGHIENPKMYFRLMNMSNPKIWKEYNISYGGSIFIPQEDINKQGVYEYFFNSSEGYRFPGGNGTFKIALSIGNNNFKNKAKFFTETTSVSPNCDVWSNQYTCDDERQQAWMITGYTLGYLMEKNNVYKSIASNLTISEIDILKPADGMYDYYATCDHNYTENDLEDFNCNTHDSMPFKKNITGPDRQSSMISSVWFSFKNIGNWFSKYLAKGYTEGTADSCDVWAGDYNCDDPNDLTNSDQGQMILAYWDAYEATGNATYQNIAKNLTNEGLSKNGSIMLLRGFWKAYEMTGNDTYRQKAINLTNSSMNDCVNTSCTSYDLATNIIAYWEAYEQNPVLEYLDIAFNKTSKVETSKCNAFGYNYSCENDLSQGAMIVAYWKAYQAYPTETGNIIVNITSKNTTSIFNAFNTTIYIENNNTYELTYLDIIIDLTAGLITENQTLNITCLNPYENTTINITILPVGIGPNTITVYVDASKGAHGETSTSITSITSDNLFQNTTTYLSENEVKKDGEFYLLFEINNTLNYTLFNISFELALDLGFLVTNVTTIPLINFTEEMNNTMITIPSIAPNETILLNFTIESSIEGTNNIAFNISTPYGGFFSDTLSITTIEDVPLIDPEKTSSSSSFAVEETEENYTYGLVNIKEICEKYPRICEDLEEFLFENNLEMDVKKTEEPDAWVNVSRNTTKDIVLDLTATSNHTIIVYDVIPKEVANTSDDINVYLYEHYVVEEDPILRFVVENKELYIFYEIDSNYNLYDFSKPYIYFTKLKELEFNITSIINGSLIMVTNVTINISSNYFNPVCVYRLDSKGWISYAETKTITDLKNGEHILEVRCFDYEDNILQKRVWFNVSVDAPKEVIVINEPVNEVSLLQILFVSMFIVVFLSWLINRKMQKRDPIYFKVLEKELEIVMHLLKRKKYKEADIYLSKIISVYSRTTLPPHHDEKIASRIKETLKILEEHISTSKNTEMLAETKPFLSPQ